MKKGEKIQDFQEIILRWYKENGRDFPWRETENLFHILVAESMLRRTTSTHVLEVYKDLSLNFLGQKKC